MLTVLISFAVSACVVAAAGSKPLPFEGRDNVIIVPVKIAGHGAFRFLLDTGASRSVVSARVVEQLRLASSATTLMMTPAGQSVRPVTSLALQLGDRQPVGVTATIVGADELARGGVAVDGIVGQDVMAPLVYTIDYAQRVILWNQPTTSHEDHRLALDLADGRALVTLGDHAGAAPALRLIPDTGADIVVLFARRGRRLPALTPLNVGLLRSVTGHQLVRKVLLHQLHVGSVTLQEQSAVVLAEGDDPLPPGDGLLPLHLFSRVTFNGPARHLSVAR